MTGSEKILAAIMAILVALLVILSVKFLNISESIGEQENAINRAHNSQIARYQSHISKLNVNIVTLQHQRDSLLNEKVKIQRVFVNEVDSVSRLPFSGKSNFWSIEAARVDSIRLGHFGTN
jgi:hypothetical protein